MAETRNYPKQIVVRISKETHQQLKEAADKDRRTPTQLVRKILEDWLGVPGDAGSVCPSRDCRPRVIVDGGEIIGAVGRWKS